MEKFYLGYIRDKARQKRGRKRFQLYLPDELFAHCYIVEVFNREIRAPLVEHRFRLDQTAAWSIGRIDHFDEVNFPPFHDLGRQDEAANIFLSKI